MLYVSEDFNVTIDIPTDDEGYFLLKCEHCGTLFKAFPSDVKDDAVLRVFCPSCGLTSENYLTEDVIELAMNIMQNRMNDMLNQAFKDLEKHSKKGFIHFKAGRKPARQSEDPIRSGIEAMEIVTFPCCKRTAKIKPLLRMTGCYCLFCGVKNYEVE